MRTTRPLFEAVFALALAGWAALAVAAASEVPTLLPPGFDDWVLVDGRVVDGSNEQPVPGAQLWLTDDAGASPLGLSSGSPRVGPPIARRWTDRSGAFRLGPWPRGAVGPAWRIHVVAAGFRPQSIDVATSLAEGRAGRLSVRLIPRRRS
jgi:hypothetical protein